MAREIKFRAFDKESSTMIYPKDFSYDEFYIEACEGVPFLVAATNNDYDDLSCGIEVRENSEIMQFTGLTDSLGRDCWEGDLVENSFGRYKGFVKYFDEFACFGVADKQGKWIASLGAFAGDGFKITGNIYENPKLI